MSASLRVVVIGASVAGLSTALLLARAGHEVVVVDGDEVVIGRQPTHLVEGRRDQG